MSDAPDAGFGGRKRKKVRVVITAQLLGGVIGGAADDDDIAEANPDSVAGEWTAKLVEYCPDCSDEAAATEKATLHALIDRAGQAVKNSSDSSITEWENMSI